MKKILSLCLVLGTSIAFAQKTSITDIATDEPTTIQITKGTTSDRDFDVLSATAEISGDPDVLLKGARDSWKKACADWKTEQKELSKETQILAINCNTPKCTTEKNMTTCSSSGSYQLKVKIKK